MAGTDWLSAHRCDSLQARGGAPVLADYLELLAGIGQDFAASLDVTRTLQRVFARIARHLDAEAASLFLLERGAEPGLMRDIASLRIPAAARWLKLARELLRNAAVAQGCSESCSHEVVLAVDEACQNVIRHAYGGNAHGEILIEVRGDGVVLELDITDFAPQIDPSAIGPRDLNDLRPGGLGTHFINECVDKVEYRSPASGAGNRLWLSKTISWLLPIGGRRRLQPVVLPRRRRSVHGRV